MTKITWTLPIKTVSESNCSEHWSKKAKRHKQQQFFVRLSYNKAIQEMKLPCAVTLVRLAPRRFDDDNLRGSMKYIRDELSECIFPEKTGVYVTKNGTIKPIKGRADSDPRVSWLYGQERAVRQAIRIEVEF